MGRSNLPRRVNSLATAAATAAPPLPCAKLDERPSSHAMRLDGRVSVERIYMYDTEKLELCVPLDGSLLSKE